MKILGIDTSTNATSVCVMEKDKIICEYTVNTKKTHSQKLMLMIENMMNLSDLKISDIDLIAVSNGPGSFTGLRIAMSTAKAFARSQDKKIITVNSLDVVLNSIQSEKVCAILDAQQNNVYYKTKQMEKVEVVDICELLENLDNDYVFVGEGVYKHIDKIKEKSFKIADAKNLISKASCVCEIAFNYYEQNKNVFDSKNCNLEYIRKSQAEIDYEKRNLKND